MAELRHALTLYGRIIAARVRAQLQYRASFAIEAVGMFLISFLDFVAILVIFSNVPQLGSWSVSEVALLYYGTERVLVVDLEEPQPPLQVEGGRVIKVDGPRQWIAFERARTNAAQLAAAVATRASLRDLTVEEPEIDDVVRRIYLERRP